MKYRTLCVAALALVGCKDKEPERVAPTAVECAPAETVIEAYRRTGEAKDLIATEAEMEAVRNLDGGRNYDLDVLIETENIRGTFVYTEGKIFYTMIGFDSESRISGYTKWEFEDDNSDGLLEKVKQTDVPLDIGTEPKEQEWLAPGHYADRKVNLKMTKAGRAQLDSHQLLYTAGINLILKTHVNWVD